MLRYLLGQRYQGPIGLLLVIDVDPADLSCPQGRLWKRGLMKAEDELCLAARQQLFRDFPANPL